MVIVAVSCKISSADSSHKTNWKLDAVGQEGMRDWNPVINIKVEWPQKDIKKLWICRKFGLDYVASYCQQPHYSEIWKANPSIPLLLIRASHIGGLVPMISLHWRSGRADHGQVTGPSLGSTKTHRTNNYACTHTYLKAISIVQST